MIDGGGYGSILARTISVTFWQSDCSNQHIMAAPSHRHQSSLEGVIGFSAAANPLFADEQQRAQAFGRFRRIVNYFEDAQQPAPRRGGGYNRPALVRLTFEYARSQESQDRFLGAFFRSLAVGMLDDSIDLSDDNEVADFREPLFGFADYLVTNFFLPRMSLSLGLLTSDHFA
jgi:hypothetical protein